MAHIPDDKLFIYRIMSKNNSGTDIQCTEYAEPCDISVSYCFGDRLNATSGIASVNQLLESFYAKGKL